MRTPRPLRSVDNNRFIYSPLTFVRSRVQKKDYGPVKLPNRVTAKGHDPIVTPHGLYVPYAGSLKRGRKSTPRPSRRSSEGRGNQRLETIPRVVSVYTQNKIETPGVLCPPPLSLVLPLESPTSPPETGQGVFDRRRCVRGSD